MMLFGLRQPRYLITSGRNTLQGYAFDASGMPYVTVESGGRLPGPDPSTAVYENVPAMPVAIDATATCQGSEIVRTFDVAESFTLGDISLGFIAEHSRRDDIQVELESPADTRVQIIAGVRQDGILSYKHYNVLLNDAAGSPLHVGQDAG